MIKIGQTVTWQTRPYEKAKTGVVIVIIPAKISPVKIAPELALIPSSRCKLGTSVKSATFHARVLIRVDRSHMITGEPLAPWYYAPKLSTIEKALEGER